jgi:hypothetical protein
MDWFTFIAGLVIGFACGAMFVRATFKLTPLDEPIIDEPSSPPKRANADPGDGHQEGA